MNTNTNKALQLTLHVHPISHLRKLKRCTLHCVILDIGQYFTIMNYILQLIGSDDRVIGCNLQFALICVIFYFNINAVTSLGLTSTVHMELFIYLSIFIFMYLNITSICVLLNLRYRLRDSHSKHIGPCNVHSSQSHSDDGGCHLVRPCDDTVGSPAKRLFSDLYLSPCKNSHF